GHVTGVQTCALPISELVRPIPAGQPVPQIKLPRAFLEPNTGPNRPRTPDMSVTGPVPVKPPVPSIPVEELIKSQQAPGQGGGQQIGSASCRERGWRA